MTFYSIIFGALFLALLREVFVALAHNTGLFWEAAILALLVFSDVIYTSHFIEERKRSYTVGMKLLDLFSFLILVCALLVLDPYDGNLVGMSLNSLFGRLFGLIPWLTPRLLFWFLLTIYWCSLTLWVRVASVHPNGIDVRKALRVGWPRMPSACRAAVGWIVRFERVLGIGIFAAAAVLAKLAPSALYAASVFIFCLAVLNLFLTAVVFKAYDAAGVEGAGTC
jgi:hypothetical protein